MTEKASKKTLIIGYGNPDRQDDGVAWHVLIEIARRLGRQIPEDFQEGFPETDDNPILLFELQLMPEHAELIGKVDLVIFIDAHTGSIPDDLLIKQINPFYQKSPFTHHLTPETCLSLAEIISGRLPEAWLVAIRGFDFGFSRELSPVTAGLANQAAGQIMDIMQRLV